MSQFQRIMKYFAIAFAIFLIFSIISSIMIGVQTITMIFSDDGIGEKLEVLNIHGDSQVLDIDLSFSQLWIKKGDTFQIKSNQKNIEVIENADTLILKEKKRNWLLDLFKLNDDRVLVVYVPDDLIFDEVSIENGVGKVKIEILKARKLNLDLGAGKVEIDHVVVTEETIMDGGAGEMIVRHGKLHDLDLDLGVGNVSFTALITGNSQIDAGVGSMNLQLVGTLSDYKLKLDKGIGTVMIDGAKMGDNTYYGSGNHFIDIDGGVGSIQVGFIDEFY
ncbi:MAG: DUF4097 family beta strand repeat-containing protein [bacterium]|nr:DUF4097 family beta strand repeat-containing protein [bacterium]